MRPAVEEVDALRAIARQVDDLARPVVARRQTGQERLQSLGRYVGQHVTLAQERQRLFLFTARHFVSRSSKGAEFGQPKFGEVGYI